ncbi:long-chain fatty acid--CoA ligase, partial [Pseudomonas syringae pv. tagetis]
IKELAKCKLTAMKGLKTLFVALINHPHIRSLDFSTLKSTNSAGTALDNTTAHRTAQNTACTNVEGKHQTET